MKFFESTGPEPHKLRRKQIWSQYSDELKPLLGNNPWSALIVMVMISLQLFISVFVSDMPWWGLLLASYFVGAFLNHGLYVFVHEATHNLIFKNSYLNRMIAIVCDLPLVFPGAMAFRHFHKLHHVEMGDYEKDADLSSEFEGRLVGRNPLFKIIWLFFFGISQALRPMRMKHESLLGNKWILLNLMTQIIFVSCWWKLFGMTPIIYLLFSTIFCLGLHPLGGRWIAEHYTKNVEQETFSYYGPVNKVMFNIGYHYEHHDFMQVPWNKLPKLSQIAPEYYSELQSHQSYSKVLLRFIRDKEMTPFSRVIRRK